MVSRGTRMSILIGSIIGFVFGMLDIVFYEIAWNFILWVNPIFWGIIVGIILHVWYHRLKKWNKYRARRYTKKHRKYIEQALAYVNEFREVVAYVIKKGWDHDTGEWEGFHLDIFVGDDTHIFNAKKRVDFEGDLWEYMDNLYPTNKRMHGHGGLFFLVVVNIFHADNHKIYQERDEYEAYHILSSKNMQVVV